MTCVLVPPLERAPQRPRGAAVRRLKGVTMGTTWSAAIAIADLDLTVVEQAIRYELDLVTAQMSPWLEASDLNRYNRAPAGAWVDAPAELCEVLHHALRLAEATEGAFDPTLGALTDLWGFGPAPFSAAPPHADDVQRARACAGWRKVRLDAARILQPGGLRLDLCGVAKGYAVDRCARALTRLGVASYLMEVGGELKGEGVKPDAQPWWIELEAPWAAASEPKLLLAACGVSVATSGDYVRFFEQDGRRYGHTLDVDSGAPVERDVVAATVLHRDCMAADALATALVVMGAQRAQAFAESHALPTRLGFVRNGDVRTWLSSSLEEMAEEGPG